VLKGVLLETDDVAAATYDMNPEQSGGQTEPVLTVKSESGDPLDVLAGAESITDRTGAARRREGRLNRARGKPLRIFFYILPTCGEPLGRAK